MSKEIYDILAQTWDSLGILDDVEDELGNIRLLPLVSSNLAAAGYDKNRYELVIAFLDGSVYRYSGVPEEEYVDLMQADSHGEYFYDNIRLVYPYERIAG